MFTEVFIYSEFRMCLNCVGNFLDYYVPDALVTKMHLFEQPDPALFSQWARLLSAHDFVAQEVFQERMYCITMEMLVYIRHLTCTHSVRQAQQWSHFSLATPLPTLVLSPLSELPAGKATFLSS